MIIWQGFGFLVVVLILTTVLGVKYLVDAALGTDFYTQTAWPKILAGLLAAVQIWFLGGKLNNKPDKTLIDPETQQAVRLVSKHTLFWIPMQYWAPICVVAAFYITYFAE